MAERPLALPPVRQEERTLAGDSYARSELVQEGWNERLWRVSNDVREIVAATQKAIDQSYVSLAMADESLKMIL